MKASPTVRLSYLPSLLSALLGTPCLIARADELAGTPVQSNGHEMSWIIGAVVIALLVIAVAVQRMRATRTASLISMPELIGLDVGAFKGLVSEAYRRRGYEVRDAGDATADADLVLTRGAQQSLVLCRHWQRGTVGMRQVRAMYGAMAAHSAQSGVVITAGSFVPDAFRFAGLGHIELIDHTQLSGFLRARTDSTAHAAVPSTRLRAGAA